MPLLASLLRRSPLSHVFSPIQEKRKMRGCLRLLFYFRLLRSTAAIAMTTIMTTATALTRYMSTPLFSGGTAVGGAVTEAEGELVDGASV